MSLSRLISYYCLLMLLCSLIFARWVPLSACAPQLSQVTLENEPPVIKAVPMLVSLRPAPALLLPGKN